ncbi:MAG TPA: (2Fe-2S)-binding protein [Segeticoccus sp.]|uniref:(2Fe-2S)-binding protein n=1 Tax=Segeticoccus sp. TaxID=2706531 RepID=UPI002D7FA584|nr:(2Fe-2S)-binding protein [Segeticoccus sp.]HET8602204.1 (2Fe-2S)-binding protein [Segeticoccus sp.]
MIICHCEVVTDRDVRAALDQGACTLAQACQATGAGQNCGGCVFSVKALLCQHGPTVDRPVGGVDAALLEVAGATDQPARGATVQ